MCRCLRSAIHRLENDYKARPDTDTAVKCCLVFACVLALFSCFSRLGPWGQGGSPCFCLGVVFATTAAGRVALLLLSGFS